MAKEKISNLGDIRTKLREIVPEVGEYVFEVPRDDGVPCPRKRRVVFINRYGVLTQYKDICGIHHCWSSHETESYRLWQELLESDGWSVDEYCINDNDPK